MNPDKPAQQASTEASTTTKTNSTAKVQDSAVENKTLKVVTNTDEVRTYTLTYPLDENNNNVIQEPRENDSLGLSWISYKPIRDYFSTASGASNDCKIWVAGTLSVGRVQDLFGDSSPYGYSDTQTGKEQKLTELIAAGKAVKLSDDVYALAPSKQNEPCTDIRESSDPALKSALQGVDKIQAAWLKSLKLQ